MISNLLKALFVVLCLNVSYSSFAQTDTYTCNHPDTLPFRKTSYDWISYRANLHVEQNRTENSFTLFFVNRIDSIIYLNFNKLGIEFVRIVLTPDEVTYVNKLDKNFYQGDYSFIQKLIGFPIDFNMIQAIFNAVDFENFENNLERYEDEEDGIQYIAPARKKMLEEFYIMHEITLDDSSFISVNEVQDIATGNHLVINYKNYQKAGPFDFFDKIGLNLNHDQLKIDGQLKNIKFNIPGPTSINIPDKFTPVKF